ncbi:MAG: alpha-1,2-fucosyltransferase [Thiotrichales bacterium]
MKKTVIFFESGRLGNQLFQYAALRSQFPDSRLVLFGMCALKDLFDGIDSNILLCERRRWQTLITLIIRFILNIFGRLNIISTVEESNAPKATKMAIRRGLVSGFHYCKDSFFQNERLIDAAVVSNVMVKDGVSKKADKIIKNEIPEGRTKIFVHIRRGDYVSWPTHEYPAVLPLSWVKKAMDSQREKYGNPIFLIFSDDKPYVNDCFSEVEDVWVSRYDVKTDFSLMTKCDAGILSASSFSWWAAYLSFLKNPAGQFLAPKYWAGYRQEKWSTANIETSWLRYY